MDVLNKKTTKLAKSLKMKIIWLVSSLPTLLHLVTRVSSYPQGAPTHTCRGLVPGHGDRGNRAIPPFKIILGVNQYTPGDGIAVSLSAEPNSSFKGFILQARIPGSQNPVGVFTQIPNGAQAIRCDKEGDTVTHNNRDLKAKVTFMWNSTYSTFSLPVVFVASVVESYPVYWTDIKTPVVLPTFIVRSGANENRSWPLMMTLTFLVVSSSRLEMVWAT